MNIGLIIHSQTGHTLEIAEKLIPVLQSQGHQTTLFHIKAEKTNNGKAPQPLELPNLEGFEGIVFGSHVEAFQLAIPMKLALEKIVSLKGKVIGCVVTQQLKKPWLGGSWASMKMSKICESKEGSVKAVTSVQWSSNEKQELIEHAIKALAEAFQ